MCYIKAMQRKIYDDTADIDNKHTKNYIKRGRRVTTGGTLSSGLRDIFVYFFLRENIANAMGFTSFG